ncbi:MAG: hypothetical protein ACRDFB_03140 [Rhabdochlamydiaceae bacterium]
MIIHPLNNLVLIKPDKTEKPSRGILLADWDENQPDRGVIVETSTDYLKKGNRVIWRALKGIVVKDVKLKDHYKIDKLIMVHLNDVLVQFENGNKL